MRKQPILLVSGVFVLSGALGLAARPAVPTLKKLTEFDLPGPPGKRFDYLTIDPDDHYLISAHLAAGQTYVIDLRTNNVIATVSGPDCRAGDQESRRIQGHAGRALPGRRFQQTVCIDMSRILDGRSQIQAAVSSPNGDHLAVCLETKNWLGLKTR